MGSGCCLTFRVRNDDIGNAIIENGQTNADSVPQVEHAGQGNATGKWKATLSIGGKQYHLGLVDTEEEASAKYKERAEAKTS